jgi:hypothetical protein
VLVDVPSIKETEFRAEIGSINKETPAPSPFAEATANKPTPPTETSPATAEKKSFVVQIVEATPR